MRRTRRLTGIGLAVFISAGFFSDVQTAPAYAEVSSLSTSVGTSAQSMGSNGLVPLEAANESDVAGWFNQNSKALLLAYAPDAFPKATTADVSQWSVGKPVRCSRFEINQKSPRLAVSDIWVAPIFNQVNEAVGAISANFAGERPAEENVVGDSDLGVAIANLESSRAIVYDRSLKSWFSVKESTVTAVDANAKKHLLGAIPFDRFIIQRQRLVADGNGTSAPSTTSSYETSQENGLSLVQIILILLFVVAIVTVSLIWLRWEQAESSARKSENDLKIHRPELGKWSIVDHSSKSRKTKFRDSAGRISLYRKSDIDSETKSNEEQNTEEKETEE
ncbi:hypothetical protein [Arcanobacterium ihumii]|uniref:hypothetical protein n=1 Tax=Arcanobacterium ihumii TaxID=2138162 RepID=UPI000F546DE2|nr:hypothetical protein [Arcanobacterium ihumii]